MQSTLTTLKLILVVNIAPVSLTVALHKFRLTNSKIYSLQSKVFTVSKKFFINTE